MLNACDLAKHDRQTSPTTAQGLDSETDQGDDGCHPVPWSGISSDEKESELGDCEGKVPERMVERIGKRSKIDGERGRS